MMCPHCQAQLGKLNCDQEPMLRNKGIVLKADHVALICPKCGKDVRVDGQMAKALSARLLLVFRDQPRPRSGESSGST